VTRLAGANGPAPGASPFTAVVFPSLFALHRALTSSGVASKPSRCDRQPCGVRVDAKPNDKDA
jgi:hypothetical protein